MPTGTGNTLRNRGFGKNKGEHGIGAGEGNRTLISGLGSPHSTTEPHPLSLRSSRTRLCYHIGFGLSGRSPRANRRT